MKLQKESLWILLAIVIVPFYFVCRETIEVKDGMVNVYKTTWWCKKTVVKSLESSCVGEVCPKAKGRIGSSSVIEVLDNHGRLFWMQRYGGFDKVGRSCRDADALKCAIKRGTTFSATDTCSGGAAIFFVMISLFIWFYKRSWRLERERQARNSYGANPIGTSPARCTDVAQEGRRIRIRVIRHGSQVRALIGARKLIGKTPSDTP